VTTHFDDLASADVNVQHAATHAIARFEDDRSSTGLGYLASSNQPCEPRSNDCDVGYLSWLRARHGASLNVVHAQEN